MPLTQSELSAAVSESAKVIARKIKATPYVPPPSNFPPPATQAGPTLPVPPSGG